MALMLDLGCVPSTVDKHFDPLNVANTAFGSGLRTVRILGLASCESSFAGISPLDCSKVLEQFGEASRTSWMGNPFWRCPQEFLACFLFRMERSASSSGMLAQVGLGAGCDAFCIAYLLAS